MKHMQGIRMPEIGEIKKVLWKPYIWAACIDCGKPRWTVLRYRQQQHLRCRKCGVRQTASVYTGSGNPKWKGGISFDMRLYRKEWRTKNREQICLSAHNRRAKKLNSQSALTKGEWEETKKKYNYQCACCQLKEPEIKLTIDHIIPLIKGGGHTKDNIQPLCLSCNLRKARTILRFDSQKKRQLVMVGV